MKKFFHKANSIVVKSGIKVEKDPKAIQSDGLSALYTGKSNDFSIVISKGLNGSNDKNSVNIFESNDGKKLSVINYSRYVKTKEYASGKLKYNIVSVEKSSEPSYILIIFENDKKKFYFEIFNNGKNTLTVDPINLSIKTDEIKKNFKTGLGYDF